MSKKDSNSRNQHYIPQVLINKWKIDSKLSAFFPKEGISKDISSKGILGSESIIKLNDNKKIEDYLNSTCIETNFNILAIEIIEGKYRLHRREIEILGKYSTLLCTFEDCFWWGNETIINDKQKEFINGIINVKHFTKYFIYTNPAEPFVLTKSSFRLRYNNHIIFPISPFMCIGLGDDLIRGKGKIDERLNKHLNEDAISQGRCGDVVVYYNISIDRLKGMCIKNKLEGNCIGLRIDNTMADEANCQRIKNWKPGEYLIMPGDNKKYHFIPIPPQ
jgi:hypothetical protein